MPIFSRCEFKEIFNLLESFEIMKRTPHQIITSADQSIELKEIIDEQKITIKLLNEKINNLTDQLDSLGCEISHAMGTNFKITNKLADERAKKLRLIKTIILSSSQVGDSVKKEVKSVLEHVNEI